MSIHHPAEVLAPTEGSAIERIEQMPGPAIFPTPRIHAVAVNATEMAEANQEIKIFIAGKTAALTSERDGVRDAISVAVENGWKTQTLDSVERRLSREVQYYEKIAAALEAGYTIVPNMPCDQFAIRVKRAAPAVKGKSETSVYNTNPRVWIEDEKEDILDPGEGRYESPKQMVSEDITKRTLSDGKTETTKYVCPREFAAIDFPFAAAVPVVMSATQAAMALKLFDRVGLVPQQLQQGDPIVLGQIVLRKNGRERVASFLIAWHLDLRTI